MNFIQAINSLIAKATSVTVKDSSKLVYDILSALRGPDRQDSSALKKATTARIRSVIGLTDPPRGLVVNSEPVSGDDLQKLLTVTGSVDPHFVESFKRAVKAINRLYGVDLMNDTKPPVEIPELLVGSVYTLYTTKYQDGRDGLVAAIATEGDNHRATEFNLISLQDGMPWFKGTFSSLAKMATELKNAPWLISMND